ncbi:MAG: riboflavin biosynthesis protein RibF [Fimbriimonadaceae bacterium]
MKACYGTDALVPAWGGCTVCIGVFDGVHVGHRQVVRAAVADARQHDRPAIVLTFDRHPARILRPALAPPMISTLGQNLRALSECGADLTLVLPFDRALADTTAEEFTRTIVAGLLKAEQVVVGHDFALGKGREGTPAWLAERVSTTVVEPFGPEGHRVSSSEIRAAIAAGNVSDAARWLGRNFALVGCVVGGEQVGRTLGYPTANLAPIARQVVPADAVYVGECWAPGGVYRAAISVGTRPTMGGATRAIEAFLVDYSGGSLYGQCLELTFFAKIRDQVRYERREELQAQIAADVETVINYKENPFVEPSEAGQV